MNNESRMENGLKNWKQTHRLEFKKEVRNEFKSESGISINRLYTPLDLEEKKFVGQCLNH